MKFLCGAKGFRPGLRDYYRSAGAGHARLSVPDEGVEMAYCPGAALRPDRVFNLA